MSCESDSVPIKVSKGSMGSMGSFTFLHFYTLNFVQTQLIPYFTILPCSQLSICACTHIITWVPWQSPPISTLALSLQLAWSPVLFLSVEEWKRMADRWLTGIAGWLKRMVATMVSGRISGLRPYLGLAHTYQGRQVEYGDVYVLNTILERFPLPDSNGLTRGLNYHLYSDCERITDPVDLTCECLGLQSLTTSMDADGTTCPSFFSDNWHVCDICVTRQRAVIV